MGNHPDDYAPLGALDYSTCDNYPSGQADKLSLYSRNIQSHELHGSQPMNVHRYDGPQYQNGSQALFPDLRVSHLPKDQPSGAHLPGVQASHVFAQGTFPRVPPLGSTQDLELPYSSGLSGVPDGSFSFQDGFSFRSIAALPPDSPGKVAGTRGDNHPSWQIGNRRMDIMSVSCMFTWKILWTHNGRIPAQPLFFSLFPSHSTSLVPVRVLALQ